MSQNDQNHDGEEPIVCPHCGNENHVEIMHIAVSEGMLTAAVRISTADPDDGLLTHYCVPVGTDAGLEMDPELDETAMRLVRMVLERARDRFIFDMQMGAN